jgi:hypothetical protein
MGIRTVFLDPLFEVFRLLRLIDLLRIFRPSINPLSICTSLDGFQGVERYRRLVVYPFRAFMFDEVSGSVGRGW